MRRLLFALLVISVATFGCNDDETGNGNNIISNISTPMNDAGNNTDPDMDEEDPDMGEEDPDMGGNNDVDMGMTELCNQDVANPGFLNGDWDVNVGSVKQFELRYCHDLDDAEQPIEGTFTEVETGITGPITNTVYQPDPFALSINWFVQDGSNQFQFGISQAQRVDEDTLTGRFQDGRLMEPSDVELVRQ